jgi:tetratricopeptide (TPR) repeat protein
VVISLLLSSNLFADELPVSNQSTQQLYPEATMSLPSLADEYAGLLPKGVSTTNPSTHTAAFTAPMDTSGSVPSPLGPDRTLIKLPSTGLPANLVDIFATTNGAPLENMSDKEAVAHAKQRLEIAHYLRMSRQVNDAEPILIELMNGRSPDSIQQAALLELAAVAQDQNDLPRAQQIYAQFLSKWANDLRVPEILLRQGLLYRRMGLYNLAFTKFYAVMTSALVLKNDQLDYYIQLVQQAQTQIAETHYELGKYADAADCFSRLLKQNSTALNKSEILYKLARCHGALGKYGETVTDAQDFLIRYPGAPEQPEVRYHLAVALKQLGRDNDSLQQVLLLLQEQRERTEGRPEVWAYWQQRTGNLIANQLYREGDYTRALEIYLNLAQIDRSLAWQVPLNYQIGVTYERLLQPRKATEIYNEILKQEKALGTDVAPGLKAVIDMARWRIRFIEWQQQAEAANHRLYTNNPAMTASMLPRPTVP